MVDYTRERVDWTLYLKRQYPLFLSVLIHRAYHEFLFEVTGFRLEHNLALQQKGLTLFYKSGAELTASDRFFEELVERNDPRLHEWIERGLRVNAAALERIEACKTAPDERLVAEYRSLLEELMRCFTFGTLIPYRLLHAMELGTRDERIIGLVEPLRKHSYYLDYIEGVIKRVWKIAAERIGMDLEECAFMTPEEVGEAFKGVKPRSLEERRHCAFWSETDGSVSFDYSPDFPNKIGIQDTHEEGGAVRGLGAFKGLVRGRVRIINTLADGNDFNEGDVLVSINTHPSILPLMRRAAAVVSDEGGIMSHAAVLSRELKIPCVIGTGNATAVFKDGDLVEVDAEKGIVRRLPEK